MPTRNPVAPFQRATLWQQGVASDVGGLCATCNSAALDINDAGDIVGYSGVLSGGTARAVMWRAGQVIPLGSLAGPDGFSLAGHGFRWP